jgi:thioredoxin 1
MNRIECNRHSSGPVGSWMLLGAVVFLVAALIMAGGCICPLRSSPREATVAEPAEEATPNPEATDAPVATSGETATSIVNVTTEDFDTTVLNASMPVVVDFWAPWCGPCKLMDPILANLSQQFAGRVIIAKVNVDEEPQLADTYEIRAIPAVFVFSQGEPVSNWEGVNESLEQQLAAALTEALEQ